MPAGFSIQTDCEVVNMETIKLVYPVEGGDLIEAGEASSKMKLTLKKLGLLHYP